LREKDRTVKALERCKKSLASLASYLDTLNVQHIAMSELRGVMADYDRSAEELDVRGLELAAQLKGIDTEVESERAKLSETTFNDQLNRRAAIVIFAASGGEVEIALVYGESMIVLKSLLFLISLVKVYTVRLGPQDMTYA
jgi:hypothetical protein